MKTFGGLWSDAQRQATERGVTLHAVQFAKMVADQNFAALINRNAM
jgi:hypothetical protein